VAAIYVEADIRAPMGPLWERTQDPDLHERWDLRFSEIEYLPRGAPAEPQRFRYATRLGFGLSVEGTGETVGERDLPDGSSTSALRFGSDSRLSLIREGSGYWRYSPIEDGVRLATRYDYRIRHGYPGAIVDRFLFRPLMGWATAWSFDRLRLWLERDVTPEVALGAALAHTIARLALAVVFAYQGLVPKLIAADPDEAAMLADAGVASADIATAMTVMGVAEVAFAVVLVLLWHRRWPVVAAAAFSAVALVFVAVTSPGYLGAAFNPVSLNLAIIALAVIDVLVMPLVPDAGRCRRRPAASSR
jgi:DoxX-like family